MYQRILSPIDGSPCSERAVEEAIELSAALRSEIRFLHVVDLYFTISVFAGNAPSEAVIAPFRHAGIELLEKARARATARGIAADYVLVDKPSQRVSAVVVLECARWPADLIVIGTHGRRGIAHLLMGSDAESIVRTATTPVLLVRSTADTMLK